MIPLYLFDFWLIFLPWFVANVLRKTLKRLHMRIKTFRKPVHKDIVFSRSTRIVEELQTYLKNAHTGRLIIRCTAPSQFAPVSVIVPCSFVTFWSKPAPDSHHSFSFPSHISWSQLAPIPEILIWNTESQVKNQVRSMVQARVKHVPT